LKKLLGDVNEVFRASPDLNSLIEAKFNPTIVMRTFESVLKINFFVRNRSFGLSFTISHLYLSHKLKQRINAIFKFISLGKFKTQIMQQMSKFCNVVRCQQNVDVYGPLDSHIKSYTKKVQKMRYLF
jgi:hypothetical protein